MKILFKILVLAGLYSNSFGWEVNTHLAIEKGALEDVPNLEAFIEDVGLGDREYENQEFQDYDMSYFQYVDAGERYGVSSWEIKMKNFKYSNLIEAGAILEDVVWPWAVYGASLHKYSPFGGFGRFNNHFINPQDGNVGLSLVGNSLLFTDIFNWAKDGGDSSTENRYSYEKALDYFQFAFGESADEEQRKKDEALLFVSLGHLLHLLNDVSVPAHTRDDAHPLGDGLEEWMRGDKGETFGFYHNEQGKNGSLQNLTSVEGVKYSTMREFFEEESLYTAKNFYSDDTISITGGLGGAYFNYSPTEGETELVEKDADRGLGYVMHHDKKIAMYQDSYVWTFRGRETVRMYKVSIDDDNSVFADIGEELIPRAIGNAKNFLNYFFRGKMKIVEGKTFRNFSIQNDSNVSLVKDESVVSFDDGHIKIYYDSMDGERVHFNGVDIGIADLAANVTSDEVDILSGFGAFRDVNWSKELTVVYDGLIGEERGLSVVKLPRFVRDDENHTIHDNVLSLEWQDTERTWLDSWYGADRECKNLELAGHDDWRLPSFQEMLNIIRPRQAPYKYDIFEHLGSVGYWSSDITNNQATVLNYGNARTFQFDLTQRMNTRCVRRK